VFVRLAAHGLAAQLPPGWEGSIAAEREDLVTAAAQAFSAASAPAPQVLPVAHFATCSLPPVRSDFGAEVVELMATTDIFVALLEYGPEEVGSELFAHEGLPRRLDPRRFSAAQLQRTLRGQAGFQLFFHDRGRAFCLYVVLGDATDAHLQVRRVEQVLATLEIEDRP
jgi:hypothetical protein